ncbi:MAG TPA: hypothetical protein VFY93_02985 [Planctomycetota bacterium]|nr:hypothetical protein [Planctomycetota bacterium]
MGAVDEMLRRRERREPRQRNSWRDLLWGWLWVLAIVPAFVYGGHAVLPEVGSRWLAALLWAGYGALFSAATFALVAATSRFRRPRSAWGFGQPFRISAFVSIFYGIWVLVPSDWGTPHGFARAMVSATIAASAIAVIDAMLRSREAVRRKLEDGRLAEF